MKKVSLIILLLLGTTLVNAQLPDLVPYRIYNTDTTEIQQTPKYLYGYADTNLNIVITPKYHAVTMFYDSLAVVSRNNLRGVINTKGEEILPTIYPTVLLYNNSKTIITPNAIYNQQGGLLKKLEGVGLNPWVGSNSNYNATSYKDMRFVSQSGKRVMLIDGDGNRVTPWYSIITPVNIHDLGAQDGFNGIVETRYLCYVYDTAANTQLTFNRPIKYKMGLLDEKGDVLLEPIYDRIVWEDKRFKAYKNDLPFVRQYDYYGKGILGTETQLMLLTKLNQPVLHKLNNVNDSINTPAGQYNRLITLAPNAVLIEQDGGYGIYFEESKKIIPTNYREVRLINDTTLLLTDSLWKKTLVKTNGEIINTQPYDMLIDNIYTLGLCAAKNGKLYLINNHGERLSKDYTYISNRLINGKVLLFNDMREGRTRMISYRDNNGFYYYAFTGMLDIRGKEVLNLKKKHYKIFNVSNEGIVIQKSTFPFRFIKKYAFFSTEDYSFSGFIHRGTLGYSAAVSQAFYRENEVKDSVGTTIKLHGYNEPNYYPRIVLENISTGIYIDYNTTVTYKQEGYKYPPYFTWDRYNGLYLFGLSEISLCIDYKGTIYQDPKITEEMIAKGELIIK